MKTRLNVFLVLLFFSNFSYAYLDFFGSDAGVVVGFDLGYQPSASLKIGWGAWDEDILYTLVLENKSYYSPVYLDVKGKIPLGIDESLWYQKLRAYPPLYYQSTRFAFSINSFGYIPISGGVFFYGNSFHKFNQDKVYFSDEMFELGFGVSLELGYTFINSVKIFVGAEYMPNWLSFGSKFTKNKLYEINTGYEINAGVRYKVIDNITLNFMWSWGRLKVDNFIHYDEKIRRIKTVEATIYNTFSVGMEYRFF